MKDQQHTHTSEPWKINNDRMADEPYRIVIFGEGGHRIALCYKEGNFVYVPEKQAEANAKRIVDCVNALQGIENPAEWVEEVKQSGWVRGYQAASKQSPYPEMYDQLEKKNASLLAALDELLKVTSKHPFDMKKLFDAKEKARKVIKSSVTARP